MMMLPLAIGGVCIITSIIGTFFVKLGASQSIMGALYKGLIVTAVLSLVGIARRDPLADRLRRAAAHHAAAWPSPAPRCSGAASSASPSPA